MTLRQSEAMLTPEFLVGIARFFHVDVAIIGRKLATVLAIWVLAWLLSRVVGVIARRIEQAVDDGDDTVMTTAEKRGHTVAQLLRSVGRVVVLVLGILLTLDQFMNIAPILAGAGILGLAISFGAQSLVKDVITGFFLLLDNAIAVGDIVEIAGKQGTVERVNLRVVQLRALDGSVHIVPNGQIAVVTNMTRGWARAVVDIAVPRKTDIDRALDLLRDEAEKFGRDPAWAARLDGAPNVLGVETLTDTTATLRVLLRSQPGRQWEVGREFRRRVSDRMDEERVEHQLAPAAHPTPTPAAPAAPVLPE
jgi:small conductance mechanosensitive channel